MALPNSVTLVILGLPCRQLTQLTFAGHSAQKCKVIFNGLMSFGYVSAA